MTDIDFAKDFVNRVHEFSSVHNFFTNGGKYLVALSGGADSVALLCTMHALSVGDGFRYPAFNGSLQIEAVHCNFHLRGSESDGDEQFCIALCKAKGIKLHLVHFDTKEYASLHRQSIEMAARELRYNYFEQLRSDIGADGILVAHHRDDSVETTILNLVRGTGIRGIRGILPRNGSVFRPLLCVSRADIVRYLNAIGQGYVTDSTNLVADVKRNKVRLNIIPLLQELNPNVVQSIFETSLRVGDAYALFQRAVNEAIDRVTVFSNSADGQVEVDISKLLVELSAESILHELLKRYGFLSSQTQDIFHYVCCGDMNNISGKLFQSKSHDLLVCRGKLLIQPHYELTQKVMKVIEPGIYVYDAMHKFSFCQESVDKTYNVSRSPHEVCLDSEHVHFPLHIRPICSADRFTPFGMKGTKLVSDYLTDRKKTLFDKQRQLVVTDADDNILWLVGERIDNSCRITSVTTQAVRVALYINKVGYTK